MVGWCWESKDSHGWFPGSFMSTKILQFLFLLMLLSSFMSCLLKCITFYLYLFYFILLSNATTIACQIIYNSLLCCLIYSEPCFYKFDKRSVGLNSSYWLLNATWEHSLGCHIILQIKKLNLSERLSTLFKATQLVNFRSGIWPRFF